LDDIIPAGSRGRWLAPTDEEAIMVDRERWEYHTAILCADLTRPGVEGFLQRRSTGALARYTPLALMPELNEMGAAGWEMISIQPVLAGDNGDVFIGSRNQTGSWSHSYLCALRRRVD
jgi:hypothetical protein